MPLFYCDGLDCQFEWEGIGPQSRCARCGRMGRILEEKTPLENMMENIDELLDVAKKWEEDTNGNR